jgi:hypothetical protein
MARKKNPLNAAKKEVADYIKDYPGAELATVVDAGEGKKHYIFKPVKLASLKNQGTVAGVPEEYHTKHKARASVMYRDYLLRSDLDLTKPDVVNEPPHKIYERIRSYYRSKDVFGSYVDVLCDLSISGFENDCEDMKVKEFYDNWCQDVDMEEVLEWIFHEFFRSGFVRTYKVLGKYEPQTNRLSPVDTPPEPMAPKKAQGESDEEYEINKRLWEMGEVLDKQADEEKFEYAERKKRWSKGFIPIAYTVLNPTEIELVGPPVFNQTRVVLRISPELEQLVKREEVKGALTPAEKNVLDNLPPEIKSAIKSGEDVELDPDCVGAIDNRRMPYEKYAINPMVRALEAVEYKEALREADYSTIDGITSEILVVTIGDKDFPVTDEEEIQAVADLFNTAQKSFGVFWNHTLSVKRLPIENIDQIFGAKKFEQAEVDISGSMRVPRALLDGVMIGSTSKEALSLSVKSLTALINYARRQVTRWLYREYSLIAESYGFKRYPTVRWDTFVLKDELAIKTLLMGIVDRRIASYETVLKLLGFDPGYEKKMMKKEKQSVVDGDIGIIGSPYQKSAGGGGDVQPTQKTPSGTPSEGRPKGQPSPKTPAPATPEGKTKHVIKKETKTVKEEIRQAASLANTFGDLSLSDIAKMQQVLSVLKREKENEEVLLSSLLEQEEGSYEEE